MRLPFLWAIVGHSFSLVIRLQHHVWYIHLTNIYCMPGPVLGSGMRQGTDRKIVTVSLGLMYFGRETDAGDNK